MKSYKEFINEDKEFATGLQYFLGNPAATKSSFNIKDGYSIIKNSVKFAKEIKRKFAQIGQLDKKIQILRKKGLKLGDAEDLKLNDMITDLTTEVEKILLQK